MNTEVPAKTLQVGWKVNALASTIASVRYRAVIPMLALESADVGCRLFANGMDSNLDGLDVLVIVKSFTGDDLRLAQLAAERGIRIVFDLCDNVFIGGYGRKGNGLSPAQMFQSIAEYASCIVTTTEPLAEAIRAHVPRATVVVIPDGIETRSLAKRISKVLGEAKARARAQRARLLRQRMRNVVRRVQTEGVGLIPSLLGYAARRASGALAQRVRRTLHRRVASAPIAAAVADQQGPAPRRIVWFGNHGAEHARFGMLDILEYRDALETIASEHDVELVVISNNREKYEASIRPLPIPSRYVEWSASAVDEWLARAAAVIVPNTLDPFSICKSANRTVLALAHGVPVVATMTPALHPLADFIHGGEPLQALRRIFREPERARTEALQGYRQAETLFGIHSIQVQWLRLLRELPDADAAEVPTQPSLAVVLHLVQDLDLALPILKEARSAGTTCEAWCSGPLIKKSPRVLATLKGEDISFKVLPDEQHLSTFSFPASTRALLTIAETNLGPHRVPRLLTEAAIRQGIFVATLQHGFENVGLSYEDKLHGCDKVTIAAHRIYTWGPLNTLHPRATPGVRSRCVPVGCPKEAVVPAASLDGLVPNDRPVVGIFENLHWHRYSERYKRAFIDSVVALAQACPSVFFLLKPHHAGLWLTKRYDGERLAGDNLLIADPQSPAWENHTASALLGHMTAVITSPSTVALDAARLGLPVAVAAVDLHLDNYLPLTLLGAEQDWKEFVAQALDGTGRQRLEEQSAQFVASVLTSGNAARRIIQDLRATAGV